VYASVQGLDFLARRTNPRFPNLKLIVSHPVFADGNNQAYVNIRHRFAGVIKSPFMVL